MVVLEQLDKSRQKEVIKAATEAYKTGIRPTSTEDAPEHLTRAQFRQLQRALGYRGSKAKRHNIERQRKEFQKVLLIEESLDRGQDRVEHPIRSRLRRR